MSQQINLYNPIFLKQRKIFTSTTMAEALGVLVLGIAVLSWYSHRTVAELEGHATEADEQLARRQARLQSATVQFAPRKRNAELETQVATAEQQLRTLREVSTVIGHGAFGNANGYSNYFHAFARRDTPGIWLTGISINAGGRDIALEGRALQAELVPAYISRLSHESVLKGRAFGSLHITTPATAGDALAVQDRAAPPRPMAAVPFVEFRLQAAPAGAIE